MHRACVAATRAALQSPQHDTNMSKLTSSIWYETFEMPSRPALKENLSVDACVIGAGEASAPGFASGPALRFPRQGRLHALKYYAGLADAIERHGGHVFGDTKVEGIEGGSPAKVTTANGKTVEAADVVVCTNGSISDMVVTHAKQAPYRSFVIALAVAKGRVPDALYWDTPHPYHYVRIQPLDAARDALIVGGEDHWARC